jgi:hypothetical protein
VVHQINRNIPIKNKTLHTFVNHLVLESHLKKYNMYKSLHLKLLAICLCIALKSLAQPSIAPPPGKVWALSSTSTYTSAVGNTGTASGNSSASCGGSTVCGTNDTSLGWGVLCSSNAGTTVGSPGSTYIQAQMYGNIGVSAAEGLGVQCNPAAGNPNFPNNTSETRRATLTNWNNPNPEVTGATNVCIPKSAKLVFMDDGPGNGTGVGADDLKLYIIGGDVNNCTDWHITYNYSMKINVSGHITDDFIIQPTPVYQHLTGIPTAGQGNSYDASNAVNHTNTCGSFQAINSGWLFNPTNQNSVGTGYNQTKNLSVGLLAFTGENIDLDFTSYHNILIDRGTVIGGGDGGDAKVTAGPGMQGKVRLEVEYECWEALDDPNPVEFISFEAKTISENKAVLNWSTASETNNSHFEVERSLDARDFETIGRVTGKGTTEITQQYTYFDETPLRGLNYYRLKQVDYDGKFSHSIIRSVKIQDIDIKVVPNPASDFLEIRGLNNGKQLEIIDLSGKVIYRRNIENASELNVQSSNFAKGIFVVRVLYNDNTTFTTKISIN